MFSGRPARPPRGGRPARPRRPLRPTPPLFPPPPDAAPPPPDAAPPPPPWRPGQRRPCRAALPGACASCARLSRRGCRSRFRPHPCTLRAWRPAASWRRPALPLCPPSAAPPRPCRRPYRPRRCPRPWQPAPLRAGRPAASRSRRPLRQRPRTSLVTAGVTAVYGLSAERSAKPSGMRRLSRRSRACSTRRPCWCRGRRAASAAPLRRFRAGLSTARPPPARPPAAAVSRAACAGWGRGGGWSLQWGRGGGSPAPLAAPVASSPTSGAALFNCQAKCTLRPLPFPLPPPPLLPAGGHDPHTD